MIKFLPIVLNFYYGGQSGTTGTNIEQVHDTVNKVHQTRTFSALIIAACIILIFYIWVLCMVWSAERGSAFPWLVTVIDRTAAKGKSKLTNTQYMRPPERSLFKFLTFGLATAHEVSKKGLTIVVLTIHIAVLLIITSIGYELIIKVLYSIIVTLREVLGL